MSTRVVRLAVDNLIGGVSQQPNSVRLEGMCEEQNNGYSSIVDGLGKRQPTQHIKTLNPAAGWTKETLIHWINRASDERYVIAIDDSIDVINIYDLATGAIIPVTAANNSLNLKEIKDYLTKDVTSSRLDLKALTVADTTIVINKKVTCKLDPAVVHDAIDFGTNPQKPLWESRSTRRAFLFMKNANFLTKYACRLNLYTGDGLQNPKNIWDPPLRKTSASQTKQFWLDRTIAWVKTFSGDYDTVPSGQPGTGPLSESYGTGKDVPPYVPDYGLHTKGKWEGKMIGTIQMPEILQHLFKDSREPPDKNLNGLSTYPGGIDYVYNHRRQVPGLLNQLVRVNTTTQKGYPPIVGSVMKLELYDNGRNGTLYRSKIKLEVVEQGDSDGTLFGFSDEVQRLSQLPTICEHGHTVKISGIEESDQDEYYVEFVVSNRSDNPGDDNMGEGYWKEGMKSLVTPALDPSTMPIQLKRVSDGKGGFRFEATRIEWTPQTVGDEESNPPPSFVGETLEDIFFWRNRLGFLAGSRIVMSEADNFFNFYRTTVQQVLDKDPIDRDAGHSRVAKLLHAVPLEETMVLTTDRTQFVVRGEPLLTPRTASVRVLTEYETLPGVAPIGMERGIFYAFPSAGGNFSGVSHLQRLLDSDAFAPFPSSGQIPRYIKGKIVEMTATSIESVLVCRTDDEDNPETIYVHKWHDRGNQRLLSAWMKFTVGAAVDGITVNTRVLGMQFVDDDLYMIVQRQGVSTPTYNLERITFSGQRQVDVFPQPGDVASPTVKGTFRCTLDRRITNTDCVFTFDSLTDELKIELPYEVSNDAAGPGGRSEMKILERKPATNEGLEHVVESIEAFGSVSILRVKDAGQALFTAAQAGTLYLFIGQSYTFEYEFTRPTLRMRNPDGSLGDVKSGRLQLLRGYLSCEDSAGGQLEVRPALHTDGTKLVDRDTRTYAFPLLELGVSHSHLGDVNVRDDVVTFPIQSKPELIRLIIINSSPFPLNPKTLEIAAMHSQRLRTRRA